MCLVAVSGCHQDGSVAVAAVLTAVENVAVLHTLRVVSLGFIIVTLCRNVGVFVNVLVVATYADVQIVRILRTASLYVLLHITVAVERASFGGRKSRYRIVREVVGL